MTAGLETNALGFKCGPCHLLVVTGDVWLQTLFPSTSRGTPCFLPAPLGAEARPRGHDSGWGSQSSLEVPFHGTLLGLRGGSCGAGVGVLLLSEAQGEEERGYRTL